MGKKNNKSGAQPMSPEKYIKEKARMLPLGKCYTYANWKDADEIMVIVTRIHPKGTVTCADFCIDKLCRGLIGTRYFFNVSPRKLAEIVEYYSDKENDRMVEIPYEVAHNLIYGSIEFAEEAGIEPVDAWDITQYILEEDDENVPLIEYQWGLNGMHYLLAEDRLEVSCYLSTMQEHLGRNFKFRIGDSTAYIGGWDWHEEEFQGCEYEIHEEVYGYELPSYPTHIKLLYPKVISYLTFHAYKWILPDHIIEGFPLLFRELLGVVEPGDLLVRRQDHCRREYRTSQRAASGFIHAAEQLDAFGMIFPVQCQFCHLLSPYRRRSRMPLSWNPPFSHTQTLPKPTVSSSSSASSNQNRSAAVSWASALTVMRACFAHSSRSRKSAG